MSVIDLEAVRRVRVTLDLSPGGYRRDSEKRPLPIGSAAFTNEDVGRAVTALLRDRSAHRIAVDPLELSVEVTFPVDQVPTREALEAETSRLRAIVEAARRAEEPVPVAVEGQPTNGVTDGEQPQPSA